jgi:hypothetical protein
VGNTKPDGSSSTFKIILFVLPPILAEQFRPHDNTLWGISFVLGALLQALVPPHRYRFFLILGTAAAAAVLAPLILRLIGG